MKFQNYSLKPTSNQRNAGKALHSSSGKHKRGGWMKPLTALIAYSVATLISSEGSHAQYIGSNMGGIPLMDQSGLGSFSGGLYMGTSGLGAQGAGSFVDSSGLTSMGGANYLDQSGLGGLSGSSYIDPTGMNSMGGASYLGQSGLGGLSGSSYIDPTGMSSVGGASYLGQSGLGGLSGSSFTSPSSFSFGSGSGSNSVPSFGSYSSFGSTNGFNSLSDSSSAANVLTVPASDNSPSISTSSPTSYTAISASSDTSNLTPQTAGGSNFAAQADLSGATLGNNIYPIQSIQGNNAVSQAALGVNSNANNALYTASFDPMYMSSGMGGMNMGGMNMGGMNTGGMNMGGMNMGGMNMGGMNMGGMNMGTPNVVTPISSSYNPMDMNGGNGLVSQMPALANNYNQGTYPATQSSPTGLGYNYNSKVQKDGVGSAQFGSSNSNSQTPLIIGLSVGCAVALLLAVGAAVFYKRRTKKSSSSDEFINMESTSGYDYRSSYRQPDYSKSYR